MEKYKFENYEGEIVNPTINNLKWQDSFGGSCMPVAAVLVTPDGSKMQVDLGTFEYGETYEDSDVMDWAIQQLETFKIS